MESLLWTSGYAVPLTGTLCLWVRLPGARGEAVAASEPMPMPRRPACGEVARAVGGLCTVKQEPGVKSRAL